MSEYQHEPNTRAFHDDNGVMDEFHKPVFEMYIQKAKDLGFYSELDDGSVLIDMPSLGCGSRSYSKISANIPLRQQYDVLARFDLDLYNQGLDSIGHIMTHLGGLWVDYCADELVDEFNKAIFALMNRNFSDGFCDNVMANAADGYSDIEISESNDSLWRSYVHTEFRKRCDSKAYWETVLEALGSMSKLTQPLKD